MRQRQWRDITLPLGPTTTMYEGDPPVTLQPICAACASEPGSFGLSLLTLSTHAGTHVDPPLHFVEGGASVDQLPLDLLCGPARVVDLRGLGRPIDAESLRGLDLVGVERLLLKTDNERLIGGPFSTDYTALTVDAAEYLVKCSSVRLVGIDYLSVEAFDSPGYPVHRALLGASPPVLIVENLDLRGVEAGDWGLLCMPLRLEGGDGGPCRAALVREV